MPYDRFASSYIHTTLAKPFVHILFGARQVGKSTLLRGALPPGSMLLDLSDPRERARFAANPGLFIDLCKGLPTRGTTVFVDEAQTVPALFDAVQSLYDSDKERWRFILCGSSARRLRASSANLLPGRSLRHVLHPLMTEEYTRLDDTGPEPPLFTLGDGGATEAPFPCRRLEDRLVFGDLPGIALLGDEEDKAAVLEAYATAYLEEEVRREATIRDIGQFLRFLRFSAAESGGMVNYAGISREVGASAQTVKGYYRILEDMFVGFSLPAFSGSPRKSVLSTPRFYYFDLGVRNASAGLPLTERTVNATPGQLFEQFVALNLYRKLSYRKEGTLSYLRTASGQEIDLIVQTPEAITPIEVKWTENPSLRDARHLKDFMKSHAPACRAAYVVSRCPYTLRLDEGIFAIPWWKL